MKTPINVLRIEAARNTGISATFRARFGRDFLGTIPDYAELSVMDQARLTDEMMAIIRANPDAFTESQVTLARSKTVEHQALRGPELSSTADLVSTGLVEGAKNVGGIVRTVAIETARLPGEIVGAAYTGVAGESLGKTLTKVALVAGAGLLIYGIWISKPFRDTASSRFGALTARRSRS